MGAIKEIVRCLATCGIKSRCNLKMCTCCVSDCMVEEKPHYPNELRKDNSSTASIKSNKKEAKKREIEVYKEMVERRRTTMI